MILVYITCRDQDEAEKVAKHLLEKRLAACANFFSIKSIYLWEGKVTGDDEFVVIAKTLGDKFSEVEEAVKEIHSYELPCILKIEVDANLEFLDWVGKELR